MALPAQIRIATRSSALAVWQAEFVAAELRKAGVADVQLIEVSTIGDRDQSEPLSTLSTSIEGGSTGVFTREVQRVVLEGEADIAVHSLKDLPTESVAGLTLAGVPARADRGDCLVFPKGAEAPSGLMAVRQNARIGTGALRRQAQLAFQRPDFEMAEIRGNVDTRLRKLDAGEYDAIVLAAAGIDRLRLSGWPTLPLAPPVMWPAVGQGALGIECREDDALTIAALAAISDRPTHQSVIAERSLLAQLRAGCHAPVGVQVRYANDRVLLEGVVLDPHGTKRLLAAAAGLNPTEIGRRVAEQLLDAGAAALLNGQPVD